VSLEPIPADRDWLLRWLRAEARVMRRHKASARADVIESAIVELQDEVRVVQSDDTEGVREP